MVIVFTNIPNTFEVPLVPLTMSRTPNSRLLTVFFLQFIFLVSLASPLAQGTNPYGDLDKMDSALEEALASNDDDSVLHVVSR